MSNSYVPTYMGGTDPLATATVAGKNTEPLPSAYRPGTEQLRTDEIRVSILGSGTPWVTRAQASASILIEVGNAERDVFVCDLGSGSLANFSSLRVPMTSLTKVLLTHLHADHTADFITLLGSYAKQGRLDPVHVIGGACDDPDLGTAAFVRHILAAMGWDKASMSGHIPITGCEATVTEVPYDSTAVCYDSNGVTITSFPVIHGLNGAVGYRVDYQGLSVVVSGDTTPTRTLVQAARGCDLLIHETFLPARTLAQLSHIPLQQAEAVVTGVHTTPTAAGQVFAAVEPRMAAMWHTLIVDGFIEPIFADVQRNFDGPTVLCQDLTIFTVTPESVTARQAEVDDAQSAIAEPNKHAPVLATPAPEPTWWRQARFNADVADQT